MLICPNCEFENPDANKFCQKCGTSLTHKACEQCGAKVSWSAQNCQTCGNSTGTVWWAIISRSPESQPAAATDAAVSETASLPQPLSETSSETEELSVAAVTTPSLAETAFAGAESPLPPASVETPAENLPQAPVQASQNAIYLDTQQRYQVLDSLMPNQTTARVRVLDCQPLQQSPLENLSDAMGVPEIAKPYLELQSLFSQAVPKVHDAWQDNDQAVVLLEDRSEWDLLQDLWKNEQVPPLQILRWMDDIASLWAALEPRQASQSLLELTNLKVDEDQSLCLQELDREPQPNSLSLQDLGKMWQTLFTQSGRTQFLSLTTLLQELDKGEISTVAQLRDRLKLCANELQGVPDSTPDITEAARKEAQTLPLNSYVSAASPQRHEITSESSESDDLPTVVLPKHLSRLDDAGGTHSGRQRNHNEDFFYIHTKINKQENPKGRIIEASGLYILCDGMGGHASGEVASAMAVGTLKRYFEANWGDKLPDEDSIREAIFLANQEIYQDNHQNSRSGSGRMGTTVVMVLIQDTKVAIAHVGDSRLYRVTRKKGLEQLTVDHEVGQREIQRGVEETIAYSRPDAYQLTQALGPRDNNFINPDVQFLDLDEDTLLLLCSDGLSDNDLLESNWNNLVPLLNSRASLEAGVTQLIDLANQYNGHDNITAVLVRAKLRPNLEQQYFG